MPAPFAAPHGTFRELRRAGARSARSHSRTRRLHQFAWCLVAGVLVAACRPQSQSSTVPAGFDTVGIQAAIDTLASRVMRAHETGDAVMFASTWARDGIMSVPGSPPIHGRDSIVAAFRQRPPLPPGSKMSIHPTEMRIMSPEWAYVMGVDTLRHTPESGVTPATTTFTFLVLLRKTAEGWQTYREVLTAN